MEPIYRQIYFENKLLRKVNIQIDIFQWIRKNDAGEFRIRHNANRKGETYDFVMWSGMLTDLFHVSENIFSNRYADIMR